MKRQLLLRSHKLFSSCPTEAILVMVIEMIERLKSHNDNIPVTQENLTRFHSRAVPGISISDYVRRIVKYASIEKVVMILVLIYVDRICETHRTFTISSLTSHRFLISAITAGSKAISDVYCTNTHFGKVGGITLQELNLLELEFCTMINWRLACNHAQIQQYYVNLVRTSSFYYIR
ncbi:cyclin-domain-containing protein [Chytridium lagenaria]|nr:cyclin-domain-containing protein [Chytridium lagenaria]